ncbi:MAG TPA: galactitol-1-phosphate 5-dehydrogenase [Rectinemataceae bacterium]|nr:galactitol-1-phosphate 5-dehydrogenase [Rectinemataceae bacterium]
MKALVLEEYKKLVVKDVPKPSLRGPDDVLVRVRAASICGSDVHGWDGSTGRRKPPLIMGHEAAGEIVEVGATVRKFHVGDRVTFDSTEWCGKCWHCLRGEVNLCEDRKVLGVSPGEWRRDGAFAEYIVLPERILFALPAGIDFVRAALAEPCGVAAHAIAITRREPGDSFAVVGTGLIGLLLVAILKAEVSGPIIALDTQADRRASALAFGATHAFDPADPATLAAIRDLTSGRGVDHAFEAVGATAPIRTAIAATRKGGSVTLIGNASPSVEIPLQEVVTRQISLLGSCAVAGEYERVIELMATGALDPMPLVSAVAPLEEGHRWFERLYAREAGLLKVVLQP